MGQVISLIGSKPQPINLVVEEDNFNIKPLILLKEELIYFLNLKKHHNPFDIIRELEERKGSQFDIIDENDFLSMENYSQLDEVLGSSNDPFFIKWQSQLQE